MNCSNCNETAEFKCGCQQPFMCPFHLGVHLMTQKNHPYENLDQEFGDLRLNQLRSKLIKRIQNVNMAKNDLASKSKSLIKSIRRAFKQASENLDSIINIYVELLKRFKFCGSELKIIEQIESLEINVRTIAVDSITNLVQNTYSMDLIIEEKILRKDSEKSIKKQKEADRKKTEEEEESKRKAIEEANKIEEARKINDLNLFRSN